MYYDENELDEAYVYLSGDDENYSTLEKETNINFKYSVKFLDIKDKTEDIEDSYLIIDVDQKAE